MEQVRQLRGYLLAMLAGAGIMVLAQVAGWPPEGRFEVAFAWSTAVVAVVAVSLALYEWWRGGGGAGHPVRSSRAHTRRRANSGRCIRT